MSAKKNISLVSNPIVWIVILAIVAAGALIAINWISSRPAKRDRAGSAPNATFLNLRRERPGAADQRRRRRPRHYRRICGVLLPLLRAPSLSDLPKD
jgi:hypothetical protein